MSNVIDSDRSRNSLLVEAGLRKLRDLLLPLIHAEEEQIFRAGKGASIGGTTQMHRVKFTLSGTREAECDMGKQYFDILDVLLLTFVRSYWMEPARLDTIPAEGFDGVCITGNRTERRGERIGMQDIKFTCDWRETLGFNMVVRLSVKITGTKPAELTADFVRDYALQH